MNPADEIAQPANPGGIEAESALPGQPLRQFIGYETLGVLGAGGMGVVFKARQTALNRLVAIKTLRGRQARESQPQEIERFRLEAEIVAQFQHPNIVQLHHIGDQQGQPYLVFEFVEGGSLAARRKSQPFSPRESAALVERLALAVHAAHLRGVVHLDLTPNNVLIAGDGTPRIADFGLAKIQERSGMSTESIAGTASYMAPEQAWGDVLGKSIGPQTDVYGLGAILYELLCGRPPFQESSSQKTLLRVYHDPPRPPRLIKSSIPRDLEAICLRCLQKSPALRYSSAEALANDLRRFLNGEPIVSRHVPRWERIWLWSKRNPAVFFLACTALVLVVVSFAAVTFEMFAARRATTAEHQRAEELNSSLYRHQFLLARLALESSDVDRASQLLEACSKDRRSFEWYYLRQLCSTRRSSLPWSGTPITSVAFSPRKNLLAITEKTGTVFLMEGSSGGVLRKLAGSDLSISHPVFSPDGETVAAFGTSGPDSWIYLWQTQAGTQVKKIGPLKGPGVALQFLPTANELCALTMDQARLSTELTSALAVEFWNLDSATRTESHRGPETDTFSALAFVSAAISPDCKYFAWTPGGKLPFAFKHGNKIVIGETRSGRVLHILEQPTQLPPARFAFSPDSQLLASFGDRGNVTVWNVTTSIPRLKMEFKNTSDAASAAIFSPDSKMLAVGGSDFGIKLRNAATGAEVERLVGHQGAVNALTFRGDGKTLVSLDSKNQLLQWQIGNSQDRSLVVADSIVDLAIMKSSDNLLFTALREQRLRCDSINGQASKIAASDCVRVSLSADHVRVAAISASGELRIASGGVHSPFEKVNGLPPLAIDGHPVIFDPTGRELACISKDGTEIILVDAVSKTARLRLPSPSGKLGCLAFQADGKLLAAGGDFKGIALWDPVKGKRFEGIATAFKIRQLAFRPRSEDLAALGMNEKQVQFWNIRARELRLRVENHKLGVNCFAFTPDGRRLVTGSEDQTVKISDAESGQELLVLVETVHGITHVAMSPEGDKLAAVQSGLDGNSDFVSKIFLWDVSKSTERTSPQN